MIDIDLSEKAMSRIIWQYQNDSRFRSWIDILPSIGSDSIRAPAEAIVNMINIDDAQGDQLDVCGRIVGIPSRPRINSNDLKVFAYQNVAGAQPYNVAPYIGPQESPDTILIADYLFRLVIKSRIVQNTGAATIDEIKTGVEYVLGSGFTATVVDNLDMTMTIRLNKEPSFNVQAMLNLLNIAPRPQGVSLEYVYGDE